MPDILLHHHSLSTSSGKVRVALGRKGIAWRSVDVAPAPPRPLLAPLTGGYRRVPVLQAGWYGRVLAIGHGRPQAMGAEEALAAARDATPAPVAHMEPDGDPSGLRPGQAVTVTPDDNARVAVTGTLVAADDQEVVIHRHDAQAGDVRIHFPRLGFDVVPA